jgi:pimeloyl-ACP methyl ester carboxylesterase
METSLRRSSARSLACVGALVAAIVVAAPASARTGPTAPTWEPCGVAADVQCATIAAPLDYERPRGDTLDLHVARVVASDKENRIGTLFLNFGGPGAEIAGFIEVAGRDLFPALSDRYDIVGVDARGTGQTEGAIDCQVNQETTGIYSQPFLTPFNLDVSALLSKARTYVNACLANNNPRLLKHFSTANTARDMDYVREALGEEKLNYLGFSYGTVLGATYATLFPRNYNRFVLDGPVDVTGYFHDPAQNLREQTAGFERALGRFFQACAADQEACSGFGGKDPWKAYDRLIDRANETPIPAPDSFGRPPVDGDDIINATAAAIYSPFNWGVLAYALAQADAGDATLIRLISDGTYGLRDDGTYDPSLDRYFVLGAIEQPFKRSLRRALRQGDESWGEFDHFYFNFGYVAVNYALWPIRDRDAFLGPFRIPKRANTALVTATTYDPATPFNGARRFARDLGNVRFLKVRADGHTVYGNTGPCGDAVIETYLLKGTLPAAGTVCESEQPFDRFEPALQAQAVGARVANRTSTLAQLRLQRPQR